MEATFVYVIGMHRSGTSAATRVLNILGLSAGPETSMLPPAPDNPTGFWESRNVAHVNSRLLSSLGGSWSQPPRMDPGWESHGKVEHFLADIGACVEAIRSDGAQAHVVKDPRFALTLPLWQRVLAGRDIVLPFRNPLHVSQSLAQRNQIDFDTSAALWLRYVRDAIRNSEHPALLDYAELMIDTESAVYNLACELHLPTPSDEAMSAVNAFLDPQLDHGHEVLSPPRSRSVDLAMDTYHLLRSCKSVRLPPAIASTIRYLELA